ncbi:hypothetical protein H4R33_001666 [Dimargaris cristalligena]|nr:hypothetical protein H4R33_001666 [Dimargaris cristalligena]
MGVDIKTIAEGYGPNPKQGQTVTIHYTSILPNGSKFDSSHDRNCPSSFVVGRGKVIRGWEEAVLKMKKGGKAWLTVTPDYGFGSRGSPPIIPPNSKLIFDFELIDIK